MACLRQLSGSQPHTTSVYLQSFLAGISITVADISRLHEQVPGMSEQDYPLCKPVPIPPTHLKQVSLLSFPRSPNRSITHRSTRQRGVTFENPKHLQSP